MERARAEHVLGPLQDMVELVRIFAGDMAERDPGEMVGGFGGEAGAHFIIALPSSRDSIRIRTAVGQFRSNPRAWS